MTAPVLEIEDLTIEIANTHGTSRAIVSHIDLKILPGQVLALIGESGSGKTTIGLAALGHLRPGLVIAGGRVRLNGIDIIKLGAGELQKIRGKRVAYVSQSAAASFNPCLTLGEQVIEPMLEHRIAGRDDAQQRSFKLCKELELLPKVLRGRFPHQVSGGQLQRLMAAMAMGPGPDLIIFDEPTTALDVTTQISVLAAFKRLIRDHRTAAIYISHDISVVAQIADHIIVLKDGYIRESGETSKVLDHPQDAYTRMLMKASEHSLSVCEKRQDPQLETSSPARQSFLTPVLSGISLIAGFGAKDTSGIPLTKAVSNVSFVLRKGRVLGVIGESGSGKSTLARAIAGLVPLSAGRLQFDGKALPSGLVARSRDELRRIQIVFQDADTALNPKHTIRKILGRVVEQLLELPHAKINDAVDQVLEMVQLTRSVSDRKPSQLSGGQKQRVNLARALIAQPDVIICDEVTSSLDPVVRETIIELLQRLKLKLDLSMIFISHDISTIATLADETMVMFEGEAVEQGPTADVLLHPQHAYTRNLINSVPQLRVGWLEEMLGQHPIATQRASEEPVQRA